MAVIRTAFVWVASAVWLIVVPLASLPVHAQTAEPVAKAAEEVVADPIGRTTPRGTLQGYLDAVAQNDLTQAARYLEGGERDAVAMRRMAADLQTVLDRTGRLFPTLEIANVPKGQGTDALDPDLDRVGTFGPVSAPLDLLIRRVERGDRKIWVIANESLVAVPALLTRSEAGLVEKLSPVALSGVSFLGITASDWLATIVIAGSTLLVAWVIVSALTWVVRTVWRRTGPERTGRWLDASRMPFSAIAALLLFETTMTTFGVSVVGREFVGRWTAIVGIAAFVWLITTAIDHVSQTVLRQTRGRTRRSAVSVVKLLRRVAKAVLIMLGLVAILDVLGVDVTTGLAALGIGGIALALGAQKTIENLVGSVTLVADQPIRVGDYCKFGDTLGTVEDIGMRSTRLRTLDQTLVTIPNGAFSSMQIENYADRETFLFRHLIGLRYETTPDEIEAACQEVSSLLRQRDDVDPETARVHFIGLGPDSLNMEVHAFVRSADWSDFLQRQQTLLLAIMRTFEANKVDFAFPSQTVYLGRDRKTAVA